MITNLCQRDKKWGNVTLGDTPYDLYHYGCTSTCLSTLSDYFGCYEPPDAVAKTNCKYTPEGYVIWNKMNFTKMAPGVRVRVYQESTIDKALKDKDQAVILNVDGGRHWVTALYKLPFSHTYVCADPYYGDKCLASQFGGRWKNIVGCMTLVRK